MPKHQPFEYDLTSETMRRLRESPGPRRLFDGPWESRSVCKARSFKGEICVGATYIGAGVIGWACVALGVNVPWGLGGLVLIWYVVVQAIQLLWTRER